MAANQQSTSNTRYFKLIAKAEKADLISKRVIVEVIKKNDKYVNGEWFSDLSGFLTHIDVKEIEFEGKKNKIIEAELTDATGVCKLSFSFSNAAFSIINSLLTADFTRELKISGWIKDGKYVNGGVNYSDNTRPDWAIPIDQQPKGVKYQTPGGEDAIDSTNVKKFWLEKLLSLQPKAVKTNFKGSSTPATDALMKEDKLTHESAKAAIAPSQEDDLPF